LSSHGPSRRLLRERSDLSIQMTFRVALDGADPGTQPVDEYLPDGDPRMTLRRCSRTHPTSLAS
jgi:hypothetical protein